MTRAAFRRCTMRFMAQTSPRLLVPPKPQFPTPNSCFRASEAVETCDDALLGHLQVADLHREMFHPAGVVNMRIQDLPQVKQTRNLEMCGPKPASARLLGLH